MTDETQKQSRGDAFANFATGLNGPVDKSQYTGYQRFRTLWEAELNNLYEQNAVAARVVDRLVDDATREGFTLSGPDQDFDYAALQSDLEDYNIMGQVSKAWKQGRLSGGSLLVFAVNDTKKYDDPLDWENLSALSGMRVIPSWRATPSDYDNGMGSASYLQPRFYLISSLNGKQKKIHHSRTIRFEGIPDMSDRRKIEINNGWGPSVLQRVYRELANLGQAEGYLSNAMHEASVLTWKIQGLYEKICGAEGQKEQIQMMVEQSKALMDQLHVLLIDSNDEVSETKRDVSGLDKILDKFVDALVRATEMPRTVILGEQPGGLNAGADGEIRGWYDAVSAEQRNYLTPHLNQVLRIIFKIRENRGLPVPTEWTIEYSPLWQPSSQEQADTLLKNMQAAQIATTQGYAQPGEIRNKLIQQGTIEAEPETEEETEEKVAPLAVGTTTGIIAMMTAVSEGTMQPAQARALLQQMDPRFSDPAQRMEIFPDSSAGVPPNPLGEPAANPLGGVPSTDPIGTPELGIDIEGVEPIVAEPVAAPSQEPVPGDLMSTREAAAIFGIPTLTVNNMCRNGTLPYWQFGSHIKVSRAEVMEAGRPVPIETDEDE